MAVDIVKSKKRTAKEAMRLQVIGHTPTASLSKEYSQVTDSGRTQNEHDFESGKWAAPRGSLLTSPVS
jgi:hypothetical protein